LYTNTTSRWNSWPFQIEPQTKNPEDGAAYELPDGRLNLIDGHLRRDIDPDMEVDAEVLDVTEEEARKLMLTIDPLAAGHGFADDFDDGLRVDGDRADRVFDE
jgi:hypothetical protein